jgi:hypothetical protein
MKLFVPTIGTRIQLTNEWTFTVHDEQRNKTLGQYQDCPSVFSLHWQSHNKKMGKFTMPAGTILVVERVFIRDKLQDFDSLTFGVESTTAVIDPSIAKPKRVRFWAKLNECNDIEFDIPDQRCEDQP